MKSIMILAAEAETHQVVTPFEEALLAGLVFVIMFGLGAGLTPKDFVLAIKRPQGLIIGWITQFGIMPLLAYVLVVTLLFQDSIPREYALPVALGALLMGAVPAGTTSNIFTYFSKGNLALSVMMTTNSTLWAIVMTPLALVFYGGLLAADNPEFEIPIRNIVLTLVILLVPVILGMTLRRFSANIGAVLELLGGFVGLFFIVFLMATWVPRNWNLLATTPWQVYVVAIGLGLFGILSLIHI